MKALKYLNKYFIKYKWRILLGIVFTIASKILSLEIPELIANSLNIVEDYIKGTTTDIDAVKSHLLFDVLTILGYTILAGVFTFFMRQLIIVTSRHIEFDLKNEIYQQYQRLSLNFYKKNRTGDLMNRISEDVTKVRMYFGPGLMYSMNMIILFIVGFNKMYTVDPTLTFYTLIPFPVLSVSIFIISRVINKRSAIVQQYLSKLTTFNQEYFSGISVLKSYGLEKAVLKRFNEVADDNKEKNLDLVKVQALFFPLMILLIGISNLLVIYIGGKQYIDGEIQVGVIAQFILYVNILTWPVAIVGWVTSIVQTAEASQHRINEFLEEEPEVKNHNENPTEIIGKVEFKNVSLTYDDTNIVALKDISFVVNPGETIAIIGKTGSGKSSILSLISRLYDTTEGTIFIDEKPITEVNLDSLRDQIGFVPQDPFLFSETIEENIKFGKQDATEEEIITAAKEAVVHENIIDFKEGYKTILGERGVTLSGGQKQRVSIARAIIKDPKILIFDDCLSAVDTETEERILKNLNKVSSTKTTFIVSHRVSSAKNADKILILDDGKIIQQGTHNQLITQKGYYKELYEEQLIEKDL